MYVCVCKAVSDSRIRRSVAEGACTVRDLARECGLGTVCGKCVPTAKQLLSQNLASAPGNAMPELAMHAAAPRASA